MKTISFKVTDDDARLIRSLARREKLSLSEYLRRRASGQPATIGRPGRVRCEYTGAMIFAPLPERPPFNTDSVREMLADFP